MSSVASCPTGNAAGQRVLEISRTEDFSVNGRGDHPAWGRVEPIPMASLQPIADPQAYATWFKALWSPTGVYFLVDCADRRFSATSLPDMGDLWNEDVVEVFLWPDPSLPLYLEYEVSPLGSELVLMVHNPGTEFTGWLPFHYAAERRVRKAVHVRGGPAKFKAAITGWSAEFFIPSALLHPLQNARPCPGMTWRANVYRIDRDMRPCTYFAYRDVGPSFHNPAEFPTIRFV